MKGRQNFLLFTTCVLLFLAVDAGYLRGLAEKLRELDEGNEAADKVSEPILSHKLSDYDSNDDGLLDYEEFVFGLMEKYKIENLKDIREDFSDADKDGDGKLNKEEFAAFPIGPDADGDLNERGCRKRCKLNCWLWGVYCHWDCKHNC